MPKNVRQPSGAMPQKSSLVQNVGALVAGILAVKLATFVTVTVWRLATREDPPQMDEAVGALKKAVWIALIGAATGAARQTVRDFIKPPTTGVA